MPRSCLACYFYTPADIIGACCDHPDLLPDGRSLAAGQAQPPTWCPLGLKRGDGPSIGVLSNWSPPGKADLRTIPVVDGMQVLWIPGKATYVGKIPELEETPVTMSAEPVGFVTTETETGERCRHRASTECRCKCHTWPLLHDRACCEVCLGCGFRSMLEGA